MRLLPLFVTAAWVLPAQTPTCRTMDISAGTTVEESVGESDCLVRDLVPFRRVEARSVLFRVRAERRGVLIMRLRSSQFAPAIYLLSGPGRVPVGLSAPPVEGAARLIIHIPEGEYFIAAAPFEAGGGSFTLETSFEDLRPCPVVDAIAGETITAALTGDDCRNLDLQSLGTNESPARQYRVRADRRGVLTLTMRSADVDAMVTLFTASGNRVTANNDFGEGKDSRIVSSLEPGGYVVRASTFEPGAGRFTLQIASEDLRTCPPAVLSVDSMVAGELKPAGCRLLDLFVPSQSQEAVQVYTLTTARRGVLTLEMGSPVIDTIVAVLDSRGAEVIAVNDDFEGTDSRIVSSLPPATYEIWATSYYVEYGPYSLRARFDDPRECAATDLEPDQTRTGLLAETACRVLDLVAPSDDERPVEVYRVSLPARRVLIANQRSAEIDTFLILLDASNDLVVLDDDSGGGTNSRVDVLLNSGMYYLVATSYEGEVGGYSLDYQVGEPRACSVGELGLNASASGSLTPADCRVRDVTPGATRTSFVDQYQLNVTSRGALTVDTSSPAFPPALLVMDASGRITAVAANSEGSPSARITVTLNPGAYVLGVTTLGPGVGDYTVQTSFVSGGASQ